MRSLPVEMPGRGPLCRGPHSDGSRPAPPRASSRLPAGLGAAAPSADPGWRRPAEPRSARTSPSSRLPARGGQGRAGRCCRRSRRLLLLLFPLLLPYPRPARSVRLPARDPAGARAPCARSPRSWRPAGCGRTEQDPAFPSPSLIPLAGAGPGTSTSPQVPFPERSARSAGAPRAAGVSWAPPRRLREREVPTVPWAARAGPRPAGPWRTGLLLQHGTPGCAE